MQQLATDGIAGTSSINCTVSMLPIESNNTAVIKICKENDFCQLANSHGNFRHSLTVLAMQNNEDFIIFSGMLGHYSTGFTLDTYTHVTTAARRQAAGKMADVLSGAF